MGKGNDNKIRFYQITSEAKLKNAVIREKNGIYEIWQGWEEYYPINVADFFMYGGDYFEDYKELKNNDELLDAINKYLKESSSQIQKCHEVIKKDFIKEKDNNILDKYFYISSMCKNIESKKVAILQHVFEDMVNDKTNKLNVRILRESGIDEFTIENIKNITYKKEEKNRNEYLSDISQNWILREAKIADLTYSIDPLNVSFFDQDTIKEIIKSQKEKKALETINRKREGK